MAAVRFPSGFCLLQAIFLLLLFLDLFWLQYVESLRPSSSLSVLETTGQLGLGLKNRWDENLPSSLALRLRSGDRHGSTLETKTAWPQLNSPPRFDRSHSAVLPMVALTMVSEFESGKAIDSSRSRGRQLAARGSQTLLSTSAHSTNDREALLEFKRAIAGYNSKESISSWNSTVNPNVCFGWQGVFCNKDQRVVVLDLSRNWLNGTISPALGNLSFLTALNLSDNFFQGVIPASLSFCSLLVHIDLSGWNLFTGTIPSELGKLSSLRILRVAGQQLPGYPVELDPDESYPAGSFPVDISNCSNLVDLEVHDFVLTGIIPVELGKLRNLQYLGFSYNTLVGTLPRSLSNCTKLATLRISQNFYTGRIPSEWGGLNNLQYLNLRNLQIYGTIPPEIWGLRNVQDVILASNRNLTPGPLSRNVGNWSTLVSLDLSETGLTGDIPSELGQLSNLQFLVLGDNNLTGTIPIALANCTALVGLSLTGNKLSGIIPPVLSSFTNLDYFNFNENNLSGSIPVELGRLSKMRQLSARSNHLNGRIPSTLGNCTRLRWLLLGDNHLTDTIPSSLANCTSLSNLEVSHNHISGNIPLSLLRLANLSVLQAYENNLTGSIPSEVGRLSNMAYVLLSMNSLTGTIPSTLKNCSQLYHVGLNSNHLTGSIPDVSDLSSIASLVLDDNNLTGSIPEGLSNCTSLVFLSVNQNNMVGNIPAALGNCSKLQALQLSQNLLTGTIPLEFGALSNLLVFDVGQNRLDGTIPSFSEKVFDSLVILSLRANNLHGYIPPWIWALPQLQILDLSSNFLTGNILNGEIGLDGMTVFNATLNDAILLLYQFISNPDNLTPVYSFGLLSYSIAVRLKGNTYGYSGYTNLASFDLSDNLLSGDIPSSLGTLVGLVNLNLSQNMFSGSLNAAIGLITQLEALDVSNNNLSGRISDALADLNYLEYLNVSNNNLSGPIPSRQQFGTSTSGSGTFSYLPGNEGLCGAPVQKSCSNVSSTCPTDNDHNEYRGRRGFSNVVSITAFEIGVAVGFISAGGLLVLSRRARVAFFKLCRLPLGDTYRSASYYNREYGVFKETYGVFKES